MNIRSATASLAATALLLAAPSPAATKPAAQVKASKGPIQLTLRLHKTKLKVEQDLWYKLELKNVGKKKIRLEDKTFKDPWAIYENCVSKRGVYLEVVDAKGKPLLVRRGGEHTTYDWWPRGDQVLPYTPEELKEIAALEDEWKKRGLTAQQQSLAMNDWNNQNNDKKNMAERLDPAKQHWLPPGASTATVAWMDRGPDPYDGRAEDDAALAKGYTQLWSYVFFHPGTYRVRAVYKHALSSSGLEHMKKYGHTPEPWWITFKTPYIEFEVLP